MYEFSASQFFMLSKGSNYNFEGLESLKWSVKFDICASVFDKEMWAEQKRQQSNTTWHGSPLSGVQSPKGTPERLKGTTQDLFELLEKAQRSRIDDQRSDKSLS
ncbi:unnamed protein product [Phaedon cochleariae]|uniref:Uncharacterized protein n=1 Tax=Phaedon cochleariae TaxID=80249 RepID=A0A9N9SK43_PHACE|nr:unnamed protein product [Phaedon cochleariae]